MMVGTMDCGRRILLCAFFLILFLTATAYSQQMVVIAKKVPQELPVDPDAAIWTTVRKIEIPLASQVLIRPRDYDASVKEIRVRALHNGKEIAFLHRIANGDFYCFNRAGSFPIQHR